VGLKLLFDKALEDFFRHASDFILCFFYLLVLLCHKFFLFFAVFAIFGLDFLYLFLLSRGLD